MNNLKQEKVIDDRDLISEYDYSDKKAIPLPKVNRNKKLVTMNLEKFNTS